MVSTPSPPPVIQPPLPVAPDPFATAQAQQGYNINSAVAQNQLNNTNQITPYGSINYTNTGGSYVGGSAGSPGQEMFPVGPNDPNFAIGGQYANLPYGPNGGRMAGGSAAVQGQWVPTSTATTTLSPQLQGLFNSSVANSQQNAGLEGQLLTNASQQLSHPLDLSWGNIASNIYGLEKNTLDPQWKQQQAQLDQNLANQGLSPGSAQYGYQQSQFGLNKSNAYDQAMLQAQGQAVQDLTAQYNSPLNVLSALRSGSQVQQPGIMPAQTATANVASAPYAGIAQSNYATGAGLFSQGQSAALQSYQAQQQAQNQAMGGLFGLGGSLIGGLGSLIGSDERLKTDIQPLGKDKATGVKMAAYRYKGDPKSYAKVVGPMAQDVEKAMPGSTVEVAGKMAIKPEAARMFGLRRPIGTETFGMVDA